MKALTVDFDPAIIKRELLSYHVNHGFVDADELLDFIEAYWKLRVPRALNPRLTSSLTKKPLRSR
jgi:hypothetical protein